MPGVTCCTNAHSCWSDFCSPAWADCGCLRDTSARVPTDFSHPYTYPASHIFSTDTSPMNPPRYRLHVTIFITISRNYSSAQATFLWTMTKIFLVGSDKYPLGRPLAFNSSRCANMCVNFSPTFASSTYHVCVTRGVPPGDLL